jgi:hypothetical protein
VCVGVLYVLCSMYCTMYVLCMYYVRTLYSILLYVRYVLNVLLYTHLHVEVRGGHLHAVLAPLREGDTRYRTYGEGVRYRL